MRKYAILILVALVSLLGCAQPLAPSAPSVTLETPANGSTVSSLMPILTWTSGTGDASYRIQVASDSSFQNLIIDEANLGGISYGIPSDRLSEAQTYYWKMRASRGGQTSDWSPYWSFETPGTSPPPPPPPEPGAGTIVVDATLDGASWTGEINYTISGPQSYSGSSATQSFGNVSTGSYTVGYSSGGPAGATFSDIVPTSTQTLSSGGTITFTLNFQTEAVTAIKIKATLDGSPWTGNVDYTITGPQGYSGSSVSETFSNVPGGTYTVGYNSGGPSGATLASISPQPKQTIVAGHTTVFTLKFHSESTSAIKVRATLDGSTWTGKLNCSINGPFTDVDTSVPQTFSNLPAGTYTVVYNHGGPSEATLTSITPQPTQTTSADHTTTFTLNFVSEATSTIKINAQLDGEPWAGNVRYSISGPYSDADTSVPQTLSHLPAGTYTVGYNSGGPAGATLSSIAPHPTQTVSSGHTKTFTLNFHSEASGTIEVNALLDGKPWKTAVGSGTIKYGISGPRSDSSTSMPDTFTNLPAGSYTLTYHSGGPIGATLISISPQPTQALYPDDTISFTLNFHSEPRGTVTVNATVNGESWGGSVIYTLSGPYVDSSGSVPYSFSNCPAGSYTVTYKSGGPESSVLDNISPSPTQELSAGDTITFTLNFVGGLLGGGD